MTGTLWLAAPTENATVAAIAPPTIAVDDPISVRKWEFRVLLVLAGTGGAALK
jgi:hypothetical protein